MVLRTKALLDTEIFDGIQSRVSNLVITYTLLKLGLIMMSEFNNYQEQAIPVCSSLTTEMSSIERVPFLGGVGGEGKSEAKRYWGFVIYIQ